MEDFITIGLKKNSISTYNCWSSHPFFNDHKDLIFHADEYGFVFKVPSISNLKKTVAICPNGKHCHVMTVTSEFISNGKYQIDEEESNEDQLIILFT